MYLIPWKEHSLEKLPFNSKWIFYNIFPPAQKVSFGQTPPSNTRTRHICFPLREEMTQLIFLPCLAEAHSKNQGVLPVLPRAALEEKQQIEATWRLTGRSSHSKNLWTPTGPPSITIGLSLPVLMVCFALTPSYPPFPTYLTATSPQIQGKESIRDSHGVQLSHLLSFASLFSSSLPKNSSKYAACGANMAFAAISSLAC